MAFKPTSLTFIIEGIFISIIGIVGLVGNLYSLKVYGRQKEHRLFHHLLLQLAVFDIVSINGTYIPNSVGSTPVFGFKVWDFWRVQVGL